MSGPGAVLELSSGPSSPEAERAVLAAILLDPSQLATVAERLGQEDFAERQNRMVFEAMLGVAKGGGTVDRLTVKAALQNADQLAAVGGDAYLVNLVDSLPDLSGIKTYTGIVANRATRRRLLRHLPALAQALAEGEGVDAALDALTDDWQREAARSGGLQALPLADFLALNIPPREWLLQDLLRRQDLALVHSWRGRGKTWLDLSLACGLVCGVEVLRWRPTRPAGVLYVDGEMPAAALQERFAAVLAGLRSEPQAPLTVLAADLQERGIPSLSNREGQAAVEEHLTEGVEVVVLDNISTLFDSGPENESESWRDAQQWVLRLRRRGLALMMAHHSGKTGQQRGTSRREDVLDVVLNLRAPSDYRPSEGCRFELHIEKARGIVGAASDPFEAALVTDPEGRATWTTRDLKGITAERVRELADLGLNQRQIAAELGVAQSTVSRALKREAT